MDIAIVIIYLVAVIVIGLRKGYRTKDIKDFAIGDKNFGSAILLATITATAIGGGSTLGVSERIFRSGIIFALFAMLCNAFFKLFIAFVICPRLGPLQRYLTLGEIIGSFYGKKAQVLTGIFGTIKCLGTLSSQIVAMGLIFHYFLGASFVWAVFISAGIVILYTSFGGIRAVAATDVIQFFVLILGIVVVANCALVQVGGYQALWDRLPETHRTVFADHEIFTKHLLLLIVFSIPFLDSAEAQRLLLTKDVQKTKRILVLATVLDVFIFFLIGCIGLSAYVLFPEIDGNLAMLTVVREGLPNAWLRGVAIAGLLAVVMSTADSYLNASTLAVVNDVILPLKKNVAKYQEMWLIRVVTLTIGFASIFIAIYFKNIFDAIIAVLNLWGGFMFVPFFAGLFGVRAMKGAFWMSTVLGLSTFVVWSWHFEASTKIMAIFPTLCMSFLGFALFHVLVRNNIIKDSLTFAK